MGKVSHDDGRVDTVRGTYSPRSWAPVSGWASLGSPQGDVYYTHSSADASLSK
jgi:hypothetical protein